MRELIIEEIKGYGDVINMFGDERDIYDERLKELTDAELLETYKWCIEERAFQHTTDVMFGGP